MLSTLFPASSVLARLSSDMNELLRTTASQSRVPVAGTWPGLNVWRENDNIVVEAEIPGFAPEEVEILATHDTLTIRGERTVKLPQNATPLHLEQQVTRFERALNLGTPVNADAVQAQLVNGVLRLTMPIAETARPRRVQVGASAEPTHAALTSGSSKAGVPARN